MYLNLFFAFFKIGLFSFGGGYVAVPLIQSEIVENKGWITVTEFANLVSIAEMTPGPIAINAATFVGMHLLGLKGAAVATLGVISPSLLIVFLLAIIYNRYGSMEIIKSILRFVRPVVIVLVFSAGLTFLKAVSLNNENIGVAYKNINISAIIIWCISAFAFHEFKLNPIYVILFSGVAGIATYALI